MFKSVLIKDYMAKNLLTLTPDTDISIAIKLLNKHKISGTPVLDEHGNLVGMLSERDCLEVALHSSYNEDWRGGEVADYMSSNIEVVNDSATVLELADKFLKSPLKRYPVLDDSGELVGQISRSDILRALEILW